MTLEQYCWEGAIALKVPIVSGVQKSLQTMPIELPKKTSKRKGHRFYEVPKAHGTLGADGWVSKRFGGLQPQVPFGAIAA